MLIKNHIPSFSVIEVLVVLLLTAILSSVIFSLIQYNSTIFNLINKRHSCILSSTAFFKQLHMDLYNAHELVFAENLILIDASFGKIQYELNDSSITRKRNDNELYFEFSGCFKVGIKGEEKKYLILSNSSFYYQLAIGEINNMPHMINEKLLLERWH